MQAAVGVAQLDKLAGFVAARRRNWQRPPRRRWTASSGSPCPSATPRQRARAGSASPCTIRPTTRRFDRCDLIAPPRGSRRSPPACSSAATSCASPRFESVEHRTVGDARRAPTRSPSAPSGWAASRGSTTRCSTTSIASIRDFIGHAGQLPAAGRAAPADADLRRVTGTPPALDRRPDRAVVRLGRPAPAIAGVVCEPLVRHEDDRGWFVKVVPGQRPRRGRWRPARRRGLPVLVAPRGRPRPALPGAAAPPRQDGDRASREP